MVSKERFSGLHCCQVIALKTHVTTSISWSHVTHHAKLESSHHRWPRSTLSTSIKVLFEVAALNLPGQVEQDCDLIWVVQACHIMNPSHSFGSKRHLDIAVGAVIWKIFLSQWGYTQSASLSLRLASSHHSVFWSGLILFFKLKPAVITFFMKVTHVEQRVWRLIVHMWVYLHVILRLALMVNFLTVLSASRCFRDRSRHVVHRSADLDLPRSDRSVYLDL